LGPTPDHLHRATKQPQNNPLNQARTTSNHQLTNHSSHNPATSFQAM